MKLKIILIMTCFILVSSCEKEVCLTCNTYNIVSFNGDLKNFYSSFAVCENDDMWGEIIWDINQEEGGVGSFIDMDIYTVGFRTISNPDIDGDGIENDNDIDIDGDGIENSKDYTPNGLDNTSIIELIICTEN